jgi:uncharacterized membrane protein HdeD (DUF308 family)
MRKTLSVLFGIMIIVDGVICLALPGLTLGYMISLGMLQDGISRIINWFQMDRGAEQSGWAAGTRISIHWAGSYGEVTTSVYRT